MTDTTRDPHATWFRSFAAELRLRDVGPGDVEDAVRSAREHLDDSGDDAGEEGPAVVGGALAAGAVLLAASAWLTTALARQVVDAAVRERFSGVDSGTWSRWAPLAIAVPWAFPASAAVIAAAGALRA